MKRTLMLLAVAAGVSGCAVIVEEPVGGKSGGGHEILVCHKGQTKSLPAEALDGHLKHGDTRGPCGSGGRPR